MQKWDAISLTPLSEQREEALWAIVYGVDKFHITNEEKQYFLGSLQKGAKFVEIKGNVLTDKFLYIILDEEKYRRLETKYGPKFDKLGNVIGGDKK